MVTKSVRNNFRTKKYDFLKGKLKALEERSKNNKFRDLCEGINELRKCCKPDAYVVKREMIASCIAGNTHRPIPYLTEVEIKETRVYFYRVTANITLSSFFNRNIT